MTIKEQERRNSKDAMLTTDPEIETGPCCYPLEFQFDPRDSRLWIREDGIRMYDFWNQWYEQLSSKQIRGIGKEVISCATRAPAEDIDRCDTVHGRGWVLKR
jgi:hypothetical protein